MGKRLVAVVGWTLGGVVALWVAFVAAYSLLVPECVTDGNLREARLHIALNAVASVLALAGSIYLVVRVRASLDDERRFLTGPAFATIVVVLYVVVVLFNGVTGAFLEVPDATAACF